MGKISFDERGNPVPYEVLQLTVDEFTQTFVMGLENQNHRSDIFKGYKNYCNDLKKVMLPSFWVQMLDGSFVTTKREPHDIDIVNFIPAENMEASIFNIAEFFCHFGAPKTVLYERYKVDSYLVPVYSEDDNRYKKVTLRSIKYWLKWFGYDRDERPKAKIFVVLQENNSLREGTRLVNKIRRINKDLDER